MGIYLNHINTVLNKLRENVLVNEVTTDQSTIAWKVQQAVQRAAYRIWNFQQWSFKGRITTLSTVSGTEDYIMDKDVGEIYEILSSVAPYNIRGIQEQTFDKLEPRRQDTGNPALYMLFEVSGVNIQPSSASIISAVSSSPSDTNVTITVRGLVGGEDDFDSLALNGTTIRNGTKVFSRIDALTKIKHTVGRVTITSNSETITNAVMGRFDDTISFKRIRFYPIPSSAITITIKHYKRAPILARRHHSTEIPREWDYIVDQLAFAFALQSKGQDQLPEARLQAEIAVKMIEEDMSTEQRISSDEPIVPLPFTGFGRRNFDIPPSGTNFIE